MWGDFDISQASSLKLFRNYEMLVASCGSPRVRPNGPFPTHPCLKFYDILLENILFIFAEKLCSTTHAGANLRI